MGKLMRLAGHYHAELSIGKVIFLFQRLDLHGRILIIIGSIVKVFTSGFY